MKKIDKIDGCHHCPLAHLKTIGYNAHGHYYCMHVETEDMQIDESVRNAHINLLCPLPEDDCKCQ